MISYEGILNKIISYVKRNRYGSDKVTVSLYGLTITLERKIDLSVPHEVTVVIPRAEYRRKIKDGSEETEVILNSITVVHAPRHPTEDPGTATVKY